MSFLNVFTEPPEEETPVLLTLKAGSLVAAVAQGERVYYVWTVGGMQDEINVIAAAGVPLSFGACGG